MGNNVISIRFVASTRLLEADNSILRKIIPRPISSDEVHWIDRVLYGHYYTRPKSTSHSKFRNMKAS